MLIAPYSYNYFKGKRILSFVNFAQRASQRHSGQQLGGILETSYDIKLDNKLFLTPLVRFRTLYQ